jgi:hypothetical protein
MIKQELINSVPFDVIINHILPYTYQPQAKKLLLDVRSFVADFALIDNTYMTQYNEYILLHDLLKFCRINITPSYGEVNTFEILLRRHFIISNKTDEQVNNIITSTFYRNLENNTYRKARFIWGLLTRFERTGFLNTFILNDDDF